MKKQRKGQKENAKLKHAKEPKIRSDRKQQQTKSASKVNCRTKMKQPIKYTGNTNNKQKTRKAIKNIPKVSKQPVKTRIKCFYANARSIINKREDLEQYVHCDKPDIIGISESWGREGISDKELNLDGYKMYREDRKDKDGGGVLLYVNSDLISSRRYDITNDKYKECLWCDIYIGSQKTLLGVCYRPPPPTAKDAQAEQEEKEEGLVSILEKASKETVLIMGDFNFGDIDWILMEGTGKRAKRFLDCIQDNFLYQHVLEATRGENILDLVLSSEEHMIENLEVGEPFGSSDHCIVTWELITSIETKVNVASKDLKYFDYFKANYDNVRLAAEQIDWANVINGNDVEHDWKGFKTELERLKNSCIPQRKKKLKKCKWITRKVTKAFRAKKAAWERHKYMWTDESYTAFRRKTK